MMPTMYHCGHAVGREQEGHNRSFHVHVGACPPPAVQYAILSTVCSSSEIPTRSSCIPELEHMQFNAFTVYAV